MTQRKWETEDGWLVLTGWDRMLQYFFIDISRECGCDDENCEGVEYKYNNLDDPNLKMGAMSLRQVAEKVEEYLTDKPDTYLSDLSEDKRLDRGNVIRSYGTVGKLK